MQQKAGRIFPDIHGKGEQRSGPEEWLKSIQVGQWATNRPATKRPKPAREQAGVLGSIPSIFGGGQA